MAAFADAMDETPRPRIGAPSKLDAIRAVMSEEAAAELDEALGDPSASPAQIHRPLLALGFELERTTVMGWCRKARRG